MTWKGLRKRKQNLFRFLYRYAAILKMQNSNKFESAFGLYRQRIKKGSTILVTTHSQWPLLISWFLIGIITEKVWAEIEKKLSCSDRGLVLWRKMLW